MIGSLRGRVVEDAAEAAVRSMREFFKLESAGGILLIFAALIAIVMANSPLSQYYDVFLETYVTIKVGDFGVSKAMIFWINDGLMAVFFFLIGMEIKREVMEGELSTIRQSVLPVVAAVGGVAVPAAIYIYFNSEDPLAMRGWAIPAATDIAFSLGILSLFGRRVPISLKIFLTAVAVIDDLVAIIIIALFYTEQLSLQALFFGVLGTFILLLLNVKGVRKPAAYVIIGVLMWLAVLKSGVHATLAGVVLGFAIPMRSKLNDDYCMLRHMEHGLHPWVAYMILPIFAFANAGVSFEGLSFAILLEPLPLGIAAGLFFGKQIGIFVPSALIIVLGLAKLPERSSWLGFYGVCVLAGVGFTMSLFIGSLAFEEQHLETYTRLGVLTGSVASALFGYAILWLSARNTVPVAGPVPAPEVDPNQLK